MRYSDLLFNGEGPNIGKKCIFVRVAGCDFNCEWCDSKPALIIDAETKRYSSEELIKYLSDLCSKSNTNHIILTGGNPALYDFRKVIEELKKKNIIFDIETQGSKFPEWFNLLDNIIISPKAPSSGQKDVLPLVKKFIYKNPNLRISLKIPVFDNDEVTLMDDMQFVGSYMQMKKETENALHNLINVKFYISLGNKYVGNEGIISDKLLKDYKKLIEYICSSDLEDVYILPQLHTLVWDNLAGV